MSISTTRHLLLPLVILTLLLSACELFPANPCDPENTQASIPTLPPSAGEINTSCNFLSYNVSFTMTAADLATWQNSLPITEWRTDNVSEIMRDPPFAEEAARASSYLFGEFINGIDLILVFIDQTDSSRYRVSYRASYVD